MNKTAHLLFRIHCHADDVNEENPDQIVYKEADLISVLSELGVEPPVWDEINPITKAQIEMGKLKVRLINRWERVAFYLRIAAVAVCAIGGGLIIYSASFKDYALLFLSVSMILHLCAYQAQKEAIKLCSRR